MSDAPVATFKSVVLGRHGHVCTHMLEAASLTQARELAGLNGAVLECEPVAPATSGWGRLAALTLSKRRQIDTLSFAQDLATLVQAGVTVKDAMLAMARKEGAPAHRATLSGLVDSMAHGLSLSGAMQQSGVFPQLLIATVAASEQTGDLAAGLWRYARHQQSLRSVRDRLIGASVYPLLLLAVGSLVLIVLLGVVVPRFSRLLDSQAHELPILSKMLLAWGQFADSHPSVPSIILAAFIVAAAWAATHVRDPEVRKRWAQAIPGVSRISREFQHLQMYRTTAILILGGIPVHRALDLSQDLLGPADRARLSDALSRIREGTAISEALSSGGLADAMATSMLAVAEKSGALSEILDRIADHHERSVQRSLDIVTRLIEPVLMIVFGILIGGVVLLMYLPIFDLASSIS